MNKNKTSDINQNHIILGFFEFDFSPDLFTDALGLQPLQKANKGEKYFVGQNKDIEKSHECSLWTFEQKIITNEFIGDVVAKFVDSVISPRVDLIRQLTKNCNVQLRIVQYFHDGCNPQFYLRPEQNKVLADINSSIYIDLYALGR